MTSTLKSPFCLQGRSAIITGGSKGLGAVAAEALANAGARVLLVARSRSALEERADSLTASGAEVAWISADLSQRGAAEVIVQSAIESFGRIDILVNSAGAITRGSVQDTTEEEYERIMRANVFGVWSMCRAAAKHMKAGSAIVNVASTAGLVGMSERSAYAASKGAVVQITRSLAVELAPMGIRVNAVAPGPFATDMSQSSQSSDRWRNILAHRVPLGRAADPHEIGGPILFLASPGSSFVTGVVLPVDGGWTAA